MDFTVPVDYSAKMKESKKTGKYLDLAQVLVKLYNMIGTMIAIVDDALWTVPRTRSLGKIW